MLILRHVYIFLIHKHIIFLIFKIINIHFLKLQKYPHRFNIKNA